MGSPFAVTARCEHVNVEAGPGTLWASIKVDAIGKALEDQRAPLAVVLAIDVSGSMQGDAIAHVLKSCELVADLLTERDKLGIVTFSTHAGVRSGLTTTDAHGRAAIKSALAGITADGNTNIQGGLEVAAGVAMTAPAGLRRTVVLMSDGQPNVGVTTPSGLGQFVGGLGIAVSTLGFGHHHDENVLDAIATAGSGRYAYVPDPILARVDLARAALAHGGIVADHLELKVVPADGVEIRTILPNTPLRVGGGGVITPMGDVFIDEGRAVVFELSLALPTSSKGRLADITVTGKAPDGSSHSATASLTVDVRTGPRKVDRDAQRDIVLIRADDARAKARAQADRGALTVAAALLGDAVAMIDATEGFVANDGSMLAEMREQIIDEQANYSRVATPEERNHQRKTALAYKSATPGYTRQARVVPPMVAQLVGLSGNALGHIYSLYQENIIGRSSDVDIPIHSSQLSRRHARIVFLQDHYNIQDSGSTNGTQLNGRQIDSARLAHGDELRIGDFHVRFEILAKLP